MFSHASTRSLFLCALGFGALSGITFFTIAGEGTDSTVVGKVTTKSGTSICLLVDEKKNRLQDFVITDHTVVRRARKNVTLEDVVIGETVGIVFVSVAGQANAAVIELRARR